MTDTQGRRQRGRKTSPRTLGIRQKQTQAVALRSQGWTLATIATELGYANASAAMKAIESALGRVESENVDQLRLLHAQRIAEGYRVVADILSESPPELAVLPDTIDNKWVERLADRLVNDRDMRLKAVDRLGRLMEREAKLHGLDAPTRQEFTGELPLTVVFDQALQPKRMELE